ncbi:hypothetical protein FRB96_000488 [Tulasnella sp. 330]|nr:hypothetical protein FRB96_000488 [Tulasnella sp. 330]
MYSSSRSLLDRDGQQFEVIPDSTSHDAVLRRLSKSDDSSDPLDYQGPSSPTRRLSRPPPTSRSTSYKHMDDITERPQPRRKALVTYGRKKDILVEEDIEVQGDDPVVDAIRAANASCSPFGNAGVLSDEPSSRIGAHSKPVDAEVGSDAEDNSDAEDEESGALKSKHQFDWRKALADVDKAYDEKERMEEKNPSVPTSSRHLLATSLVASLPSSSTSRGSPKIPAASSKSRTARRSIVRVSSSESASDRDSEPEHSSTTARKSKKQRRAIVPHSDSDEASPIRTSSSQPNIHPSSKRRSNSLPSSDISPAPDRVFGSPPPVEALNNSARLSSPPTSPNDEDEEPVASTRVPAVDFTGEMAKGKMKRRKSEDKAAKEKPQKVKSLSKKVQLETTKEQARIMASKPVIMPAPEEQPRFLISNLFQKVQGRNIPKFSLTSAAAGEISSDPIVGSSQVVEVSGTCTTLNNSTPHTPDTSIGSRNDSGSSASKTPTKQPCIVTERPRSGREDIELCIDEDDDGVDLPTLKTLDKQADQKKAEREACIRAEAEQLEKAKAEERFQEFRRKKQEIAARQMSAVVPAGPADEDDDEELEIEATAVDPLPSKSGFTLKAPPYHISSKGKPTIVSRKSITDAATTVVTVTSKLMTAHHITKVQKTGTDQVMEQLRKAAIKQNTEARKNKEEEWLGRGGKSAKQKQIEDMEKRKQVQGSPYVLDTELSKWVSKGVAVEEETHSMNVEDDDDDDEEDEDFTPGDEENKDQDENGGGNEEESSDKENASPGRPAAGDETLPDVDQENAPPRAPLQSRSVSPAPPTEDGENEPEDKENVPPASRPRRQVQLDDEDDLFSPRRRVSQSSDDEAEDDLGGPIARSRAPLRTRRVLDEDEEEDVNDLLGPASGVISQASSLTRLGAALTFDSEPEDDGALSPGRAPLVFGGGAASKTAVQESQECLDFDMGEAGAEGEGDGFTQLFKLQTKTTGFDALRRREALDDMDFESQKLLPAMNLSTQELQKDNAIFEEDQLANAMLERQERRKTMAPKQYLNEDGFFTQTKPATQPKGDFPLPFDSPAQAFGTQANFDFGSQFFDNPVDSQTEMVVGDELSQAGPLRRLVRGRARDENGSEEHTVTPQSPAAPKDVFQVLMQKKPKDPSKALKSKEKQKAIQAAFVQGEAHESDEDIMQGFGVGGKEDDEDDDDEEQNKVVEGLVDDEQMDASVENEEAVREKAAEHAAAADAEDERVAKLAAEGKLRGKKRDRGIGLDDDVSDEEEDDADRRRRLAVNKKRKINGDNLEELAKNPRTVPFYNQYQHGIALDDDDDFGAGPSSDAVDAAEGAVDDDYGADGADDDDDEDMEGEDSEPRETISVAQIRREAVEAARRGETAIDPDDISWMSKDGSMLEDEDDMTEDVIELPLRKTASRTFGRTNIDQEALKEKFRLNNLGDPTATRSRSGMSAKGKGPAAYGPNKAGSAITGRPAVTKKNSLSSSVSGSVVDAQRKGPQSVTRTASMLSKVNKKGGFVD